MKITIRYLSIIFFMIISVNQSFADGEAPSLQTRGEMFSAFYEEKPRSLLIMPPMNFSTAADAKIDYSTTIEVPLSQAGFYVFPYELTSEILKQQGVYDTELLYNLPLSKLHEYFGADAVLFTKIQKWDIAYNVMSSIMTVSIDAEIKSTRTERVLWKYNGTVISNLAGGQTNILGAMLAAAITSAMADYVSYADYANTQMLKSLPFGYYHPLYLQDQGTRVKSGTMKLERAYRTLGDDLNEWMSEPSTSK